MIWRYAAVYVLTAVVFLVLDALYLRFLGAKMYSAALGDQMASPVRVVPAVVFYLIYIAGILYFAITPALNSGQWTDATVRGALLGFLAYATYEFTNYATLARWNGTLVFADLVWGTVVTAIGATAGCALAMRLGLGR